MSKMVRDAMTSQPVTVRPSESVRSAAELMAQQDIGSLPVVDEHAQLVGMVTDRDIAIRAVAAGRDADATPVKEILTSPIVQVVPDDSLDMALELMAKYQVRRLPVVYDTQLVGVLAQADIAHEANDKKAGQVLEAISQPTPEHATSEPHHASTYTSASRTPALHGGCRRTISSTVRASRPGLASRDG